jgi:hypothetical protein
LSEALYEGQFVVRYLARGGLLISSRLSRSHAQQKPG